LEHDEMAGTRRTPRTTQYRSVRITPEGVDAFRRGDAQTVHVLLHLRPWEMSPCDVHLRPEPSRDTQIIYLQSWWFAMRLRDQLLAAAAGVAPANAVLT
jgi:hypothetical protein